MSVLFVKCVLAAAMGWKTAEARYRFRWTAKKYHTVMLVGIMSMCLFIDLITGEFGVK